MNVPARVIILLMLGACARSARLPPLDDACAVDDDCAYARTYLVDGKCCDGTCEPVAASKAHVKALESACVTLGRAQEECPMKKCLAPPPVKCVAGHCALVKE